MDGEMRLRLPQEDKDAFEEAANQMRISLSAFTRMACWDKIRSLGLLVGKDRDRANERRQRIALQINMIREFIRIEPELAKAGEPLIADMEGKVEQLTGAGKRGKGGGR